MNGMNISISLQLTRFLLSCLFGVFLAFVYDLMRILRRGFHHSHLVTNLTDALFSFLALTSFALFVLIPCEGDIRFFLIIGFAMGMLLYFLTLSRLILRSGELLICGVQFVFRVLWYPFTVLQKYLFSHRQKRSNDHGSYKQKKESG